MSSDHGIRADATDGVLRLVVDRPDRKGALDVAAQRTLVDALEHASTDDSLRVIVISGTGDDFCTGADVVAANSGDAKPRTGSIQRRTPLQAHRLIALLHEIQLPVVARVQGWAAGLGCQIALASDFVVAADDSSFWIPMTKRGFTPDSGATWLLPRLVGVARAKEMVLLGRPIKGSDAADWGLIHRAVPSDRLDAATDELVDELKTAATVAVGLAKRGINAALDGTLAEAMEAESMALELSSRTADFREGMAAFRERRDPKFEGR